MFTWLSSSSALLRSAAAVRCLRLSITTLEKYRILATGLLFTKLGGLAVFSIRDLEKTDKSATKGCPFLLATSIFGASFGPTSALPVYAAEFGTRDQAIAMVLRVQEKFRKEGPEATFKAINGKEWVDHDLFPWVYRLEDGMNMAGALFPAMRGQHLIDLKDQNGKFIVREWIKIATTPPYHGWSNYRWLNPVANAIDDNSSWIERMGDYLVGVAVHGYEQPNENTIGLISGSPNSDDTDLQMAYDLAAVLNDGANLRILPIVGIGGPRNIRDVRHLRGVDIGLTQTDVLNNFRRSDERMGQAENKIVYIAKLFNEEIHLVAKPNITSIEQLRGLKVNFDANGSGTSYSMRGIFKALGIDVEEISMCQVDALERVKSGEIAATALIAGKPVRTMSMLNRTDQLHFVSIPYPSQLIADYLPTSLTHDDYPEMIPVGQTVDTVAVGAVLIAYDWPKTNGDRYGRVQRFVEAFFPKIAEFQKPPRHVKWHEVNLAAKLPGWTRFEAAQAWLDSHQQVAQRPSGAPAAERPMTDQAAPATPRAAGSAEPTTQTVAAERALYQQFLKWRAAHASAAPVFQQRHKRLLASSSSGARGNQ
jgi:uncharacterized protein